MSASLLWKDGHEPINEVLHNAVTRDLYFERNGDGDFFYYIKEGIRIVYTSGRFWDQEDCARDGFYMLKKLHEDDPLRHDDGDN